MKLGYIACFAGVAVGLSTIVPLTGCTVTDQVRQVYMALDDQGQRVRNVFDTDTQSIYCDVVWSGRGTDNTVQAVFIQTQGENDLFDGSNTLVSTNRQWVTLEQQGSPGISTIGFEIVQFTNSSNGDPLPTPVGSWTCEIYVNGEMAGSTNFTVQYPLGDNGLPDCPPQSVTSTGNSCAAYLSTASCPSAADYTNHTACTCQVPEGGIPADRVWVCP